MFYNACCYFDATLIMYRNFPTSCNGYSKKREVLLSITAFDLVTLVQTLQRLQTTTNSVIVVHALRFSLFAVARSSKSSVSIAVVHLGCVITRIKSLIFPLWVLFGYCYHTLIILCIVF